MHVNNDPGTPFPWSSSVMSLGVITDMFFFSSQTSSPVNCPPSATLPVPIPATPTLARTVILIPTTRLDVQALTEGDDIVPSLLPAFKRYNEAQLATVKLPGSSQEVGFAREWSMSAVELTHFLGRSLLVGLTSSKTTATSTRRAKPRSRSTIPHR
jgi:hypothetical protein